MKMFEKWYNELSMREDEVDFTIPTYESYKRGWKAALEWTLETAKELNEQDAPISMNDVIKAELEGK